MSQIETRRKCLTFKFKDLNFNNQPHLFVRIAENSPSVKKGDTIILISSCETKREYATIHDVLEIPFVELATTHKDYLKILHNKNCRTYESLKICMGNYYKKDMENESVTLIIFKLKKYKNLFDDAE